MTRNRAAPRGATPFDVRADADAQVRWLTPRGAASLRDRPCRKPRRSRRSLGRFTAALGVGAILTVTTVQSAVAPAAAHAPRDLAGLDRAPLTGEAILLATRGEPARAVEVAMLAESPAPTLAPVRAVPAVPFDLDLFTGSTEPKPAAAPAPPAEPAPLAASSPLPVEAPANEVLRFGGMRIPRPIVETILRAAEVTGVDPAYMMALADKESSFAPEVKASTSSAQGLFQFLERTWLEMVRDFGEKHGMAVAASLVESANGQPVVRNELLRDWVLGLRRDPYRSAVMAAEMLKRDKAKIERRIGRELERSELYLMHFFGAESAGRLLELIEAKPKQSAPKVFPAAARANRTLFFAQERRKKARQLTVAEVYSKLDRMIDSRLDRYDGVAALAPVQASFAVQ